MIASKLKARADAAETDGLWRRLRFRPANLQKIGIFGACVLLVAVVTIGNADFLSLGNIENMLSQWAPAGVMAVGMTFVVIAGGFDLSAASIFSLCGVVAAMVGQTQSPGLALLCALLVGVACGLANAGLVLGIGINPFIATVGSGFVINGVSLVFTQNAAFIVSNPDFGILGAGRWQGLPYSGMILIALILAAAVTLSRTVYGHMIYAVGGSAEASRLSGLPVKLVGGSTYVFLGLCSGLAGFISASQLNSAQSNVDPNLLFDVMTVVVVGGTSLGGGVGSILQTVLGLIIVATITNGFVLLDISPFYQDILKGAIILIALSVDIAFKSIRRKA